MCFQSKKLYDIEKKYQTTHIIMLVNWDDFVSAAISFIGALFTFIHYWYNSLPILQQIGALTSISFDEAKDAVTPWTLYCFILALEFFSEFIMMLLRNNYTCFYTNDTKIIARTFIRHFYPGLTYKKVMNWNTNEQGKIFLSIIRYTFPKNSKKGINPKNYIKAHQIYPFKSFTWDELTSVIQMQNDQKFDLHICTMNDRNFHSLKAYALAIDLSYSALENIIKSIERIVPIEFLKIPDGSIDKYLYKNKTVIPEKEN